MILSWSTQYLWQMALFQQTLMTGIAYGSTRMGKISQGKSSL